MSAIEHTAMPVLLVNCDPTDASSAHFDELASRVGFTVLDAPTRPHHVTLNWLFRALPADLVLLLDSDAEIRASSLVARLRGAFDDPVVFGSGFVEEAYWFDETGSGVHTSMKEERPWMHCVVFRTAHVRRAIAAGATFAPRTVFNDVRWSRRVSKALAARFQVARAPQLPLVGRLPAGTRARLQRADLPWLAWARSEFHGERPNYLVCDTGAVLYKWCARSLEFSGDPSGARNDDEVFHFGGVTRMRLGRAGSYVYSADELEHEVAQRLSERYGIVWREPSR
jgi:hypothetical protein